MKKLSQKGFTLVELLVVITIIGVLAAVVLIAVNPNEQRLRATDAQMKQNVSQVAKAVEANYTASGANGTPVYAASVAALITAGELKVDPGVSYAVDADSFVVYGMMNSNLNKNSTPPAVCAGATPNRYWSYRGSATGASVTAYECGAATLAP